MARKLGYQGYRGLQAAAQAEITGDLTPAAQRIRRTAARTDDPLGRALAAEVANVEATLRRAEPAAFAIAVRLLADRKHRVLVLAGDAERGIAATAADQLGQLRDGVELVDGTPPRRRQGGRRRAERRRAGRRRPSLRRLGGRRHRGAARRRCVDRRRHRRPPVAARAEGPGVVRGHRRGPGPFDSHVGTLALLHALVAGVADRLRGSAVERLDLIEAAWRTTGALHD